jgi:hypothetical protein
MALRALTGVVPRVALFGACCLGAIGLGVLTAASPVAGVGCAAAVLACATVAGVRRGLLALAALAVGATAIIGSLAIQTTALPHQLRLLDNGVLLIGVALLPQAVQRVPSNVRRPAGLALLLLLASEAVGFVDPHVGLGTEAIAAWQDLRWLGAIGLGLAIGERLSQGDRFTWAFRILLTWNILNLLVSIAEFGGATATRLGIPFTGGVFGHQSLGSTAAVMLIVLTMSHAVTGSTIRLSRQQLAGLTVAILCIVLGTRFKALIPLVVIGGFLLVFKRKMPAKTIAAVTAAVPLVIAAILFVYSSDTRRTAYESSDAENGSVVANALAHGGTRATLLSAAITLANRTAPVGRGLGTFGANLEGEAEQRTFESVGLGNVWGFSSSEGAYRSDNFLAQVLAERGYLGLVLFLCALVPLLLATVRISGGEWLTIAGLVTAVVLSPVAATFNSAPLMLILVFPAALAARSAGMPRVPKARRTVGAAPPMSYQLGPGGA